MFSIRKTRLLLPSSIIALALLGLTWLKVGGPRHRPQFPLIKPLANDSLIPHPTAISPGFQPGSVEFWDTLSKALVEAAPKCSIPDDGQEPPINAFAKVQPNFNFRPDILNLPPQDVEILRGAHARFVARIPDLAPRLPFAKGSKGIVTTAAAEFVPILIVSLRTLRRTGSKLPVEVLMESEAVYEPEICEAILPALNARCLVMTEILGKVPEKVEISRYQLKAFALLFSSFDEILLLDADNLAMEPPEQLLSTEPFVSKGFVSWPDYWANTASPLYYTISSQSIPPTHSRASSESGQLLISKTLNAPILLLTIYYNFYGPSHYYKLLSQGAVGEGDKETYLAAAMALNSTYYTVASNVETLGYFFDDRKTFKGCGAVQHNPLVDYTLYELQNDTIKAEAVPRSFIHAQTYKMDAATLPDTFHSEINQRMWGPKEAMVEKFGRDIEKQLWADTLYTGCQLEHSFKAWENKTGVCKKIGRVYKFLFN